MDSLENVFIQLKEKIESSSNILITLSNPDGDSLGSGLGLARILKAIGKNIDVVSSFVIPEYLKFIPDETEIKIQNVGKIDFSKYDFVILVDSSDPKRVIEYSDYPQGWAFPENVFTVCFDHHTSHNSNFAGIDVYYQKSSSTCEIVFMFAKFCGYSIDKDTATQLFTGMYTDSGGFYFDNTTDNTYKIAGELMNKGADKKYVLESLNRKQSFNSSLLYSKAIQQSQIIDENSFSYLITVLPRENFIGLTEDEISDAMADIKGKSNYLQNTVGTEFGVVVSHKKEGNIDVSFRSRSDRFDLTKVCEKFDGGGHPKACGFSSTEDINVVVEKLKEEIRNTLK